MNVSQEKALAQQWVNEEGAALPGFQGAFFHGSINTLPDDAVLPETSDLDIMVVLSDPDAANKLGKFRYHGVLLEVSYLPADQVQSAEQVLSNYHLAGSFREPGILLDPTGHLTALQETVGREFAERRWVIRRCEHAQSNILNMLQGIKGSSPFYDQVMPWLFATGVTTHVLLVAGLRNPTVRRRYEAVRELLAEHGRLDFYETLLELLGCAHMSRESAGQHLAALTEAFDAAGAVLHTPYRFAADLRPDARPVAIDGSRELIARGHHRDAVFWMAATYSRCQWVLHQDAPATVQERFDPGYRHLLADLGITSFADMQQRGEEVRQFLPRLWEVAEEIIG